MPRRRDILNSVEPSNRKRARCLYNYYFRLEIMRFKLVSNRLLLLNTLESEIYSMLTQCAIVLLISDSSISQDLSICIKSLNITDLIISFVILGDTSISFARVK